MGVQKHYKKRFANKIVSKSFKNKIDQKSKTDFFSRNTIKKSDVFFEIFCKKR